MLGNSTGLWNSRSGASSYSINSSYNINVSSICIPPKAEKNLAGFIIAWLSSLGVDVLTANQVTVGRIKGRR